MAAEGDREAPGPPAATTGFDTTPSTTSTALTLAKCSREELQRVIEAVGRRDGGEALVQEALAGVLKKQPPAAGGGGDGGGGNKPAATQQPQGQGQGQSMKNKKKGAPREFDFSRFSTRHIALQLAYEGDRYLGFSTRHDGDEETVEGQLLAALMKTKLIKDRAWACYSRCGRTDKGVSALRQVVGIRVRSALPLPAEEAAPDAAAAAAAHGSGSGEDGDDHEQQEENAAAGAGAAARGDIWSTAHPMETAGELDYCAMLNRVLPPDIRCLGWAPTPAGFSARFCASHRTYRYFFDGAGLDLGAMQRAARRLEGDHDFRNFCKMDATAVHSFRRVVHRAQILPVGGWRWAVDTEGGALAGEGEEEQASVCCLQIQGQAFLWHMVRCIMAVLFLVGRGLEEEGVVDALFDVEGRFPAKPHYAPAPDGPLVLHDCAFATLQGRFHHTPATLARLWGELRAGWGQAAVRLARVENALAYVAELPVAAADVEAWAAEERARAEKGRSGGGGNAKKRKRAQAQQQQQQQSSGLGGASGGDGQAMEVEVEVQGEEGEGGSAEEGNDSDWSQGRREVPWREALRFLEAKGLSLEAPGGEDGPRRNSSSRYIPLAQRAVGKTYEETVADLSGRKRALYEEAQQKREAGAKNGGDQAFFARLRGQAPPTPVPLAAASAVVAGANRGGEPKPVPRGKEKRKEERVLVDA